MCGISGLISNNSLNEKDLSDAKLVNRAITHRGPDGEGWFQDEKYILGMRRLSIIDLSGANQPLYGSQRDVVVLFNGEIYNFLELRKELEQLGRHFYTDGDGEVIPHLYELYGLDFVHKLRGMFAITLLDKKKERLYLFRDRMGEKPIYYSRSRGRLLYSSELKALCEVMGRDELKISPEAVHLYLHYQFVPEPRTLIDGILKVPAGHYLDIDLATVSVSVHKYWELSSAPAVKYLNPAQKIREKLDSIIRIIGRSDVPVGIALSGGVDSSTVAALFAHENHDKQIAHAFTVGYEGSPPSDERKQAKALADKLSIPMHETELRTVDFVRDFPQLVRDMDDPIADIAAYSIFSVMRAAKKENIKVLLNGVGADEIFWGYPWTSQAARESVNLSKRDQFSRLSFYNLNSDFNFARQYSRKLYSKKFLSKIPVELAEAEYNSDGVENISVQIIDRLCKGWLFGNPVALGDRLSMANSVELRSPFLDHELVELMVGLNKENSKIFAQQPKALLKDAVRGLVPDEVLDRPKQGFTPPVLPWRLGVIKSYARLLWNGQLMEEGIVTRWGLLKLLIPTKLNRLPYAALVFYLYKLILLEIWCRSFVRKEVVASR